MGSRRLKSTSLLSVHPTMSSSLAGPPSSSPSAGMLLQDAASALDDAAKRMKLRKDISSEIKRLSSELGAVASAIAVAVCTSCDNPTAPEFPLSSEPVVACATDVFTKIAVRIEEWKPRRLRRNKLKDELKDCNNACQAFHDILAIDKGRSLLIDGDRAINFPRPPGWKEDTSNFGKRISSAHTVYQGFKTLLTALVNAGDGATLNLGAEPIQPKAFAQLVLQTMKQVEEFKASKDNVEKLQSAIESTWGVIVKHYRPDAEDAPLDDHIRKFLRLLMRIVVRLHLLRATHCIKRFVAVVTVNEVIVEETAALNNAKGDLMMALSLSSRAAAANHHGDIRVVQERVVRIGDSMEASGQKLDVIASGVDDTSFQHWLGSSYDFESRQYELQRQIDEIPEWMISDPQFEEWRATQGIYWISSTPGSGKSVLLAAVVQHLDTRDRVYFYFDKRNEAQQPTFRDFLVAILRQLAARARPNPPQLKAAYASRVAGQKASEEVLADALKTMIGSEPRVALAIDALDECPADVRECKLYPLINRLVKGSARIIVTSREIDDITEFMPENVKRLRLDRNHHQAATLCSFVDSQLATSNYKSWSADLKDEVKEILTDSHCMFLWVRLQLERLKCAPTPTAVRKMVHSLPPSLNATYERILRDFTPTNDQLRIILASRILQCVAMSTESLSPDMVAELFAFEFPPGNEIPLAGRALAHDQELFTDDPEALLRSHCPALLQITEANTVSFIHVSVLEYLQSTERFRDPVPVCFYAFTSDWAHLTWLHVCLSIFEHKLELKLTSHAKNAWVSHLISTTDSFREEVLSTMLSPAPVSLKDQFTVLTSFDDTAIHYACRAGRSDLIKWFAANGPNLLVDSRDAWQNSALHIAAEHGHLMVVELLLDHGAPASATNEHHATPLHFAVEGGYLQSARPLLNTGGPLNAQAHYYDGLPLHYAVRRGKSEIVELLLERGAAPSATNVRMETPLHLAAREGFLDAVRLLLGASVPVDARDEYDNSSLHLAIQDGHSEIVQLLLEHGAPPSSTNNRKRTPLHLAARKGCVDLVQLLLDAGAPVDARDDNDDLSLHLAVQDGHSEIVKLLLRHGAPPSAANNRNRKQTPLQLAAMKGFVDLVQLLLDAGAPVDARDDDNYSSLHMAILYGHSEIVQLLLEHGAPPSAANNRKQTPLHLAARNGCVDLVQLLLDADAQVDARDNVGNLPLHEGFWKSDVVELLLERGAPPSATNKRNQTPLHLAVQTGSRDAVRLLLDAGAQVDVRDDNGNLALHCAVQSWDWKIVELLLERSAPPSATNKRNQTPLHLAAGAGRLDAVRLLLDAAVPVDVRDDNDNLPLHCAARSWGSGVVELLLKYGALPSATNRRKKTPLHLAAQKSRLNAIQVLLDAGALVDAQDDEGYSPLHYATWSGQSWSGKSEVVELLLKYGAPPSATNKHKETPLHLAAGAGRLDAVRLLLDAAVPVDARDDEGQLPLHCAAQCWKSEVVELLLERGAPPSATNKRKETPLHLAAQKGCLNAIQVLLDAGALVDAQDAEGHSPLQNAERNGHSEVVELLLKHGAPSYMTNLG